MDPTNPTDPYGPQAMSAALMQPQQPPPQQGGAQNPADLYVSMGEQQGSRNQSNLVPVPDAYGAIAGMPQLGQIQPGGYPPINPLSQQNNVGPLAGAPSPLNTNAQLYGNQMSPPYSTG